MNLVSCASQDFVSSTKRPFPSELELVDFKEKPEDTRQQINKSVSELTDGKYNLALITSLRREFYFLAGMEWGGGEGGERVQWCS